MSELVQQISERVFDKEVVKSSIPVVVDFWAPWCGPCRVLGPILEEIAGSFVGKAKIVKVNVDENSSIASKFGVMNIPTVVFLKQGQEIDRMIGVGSKDDIEARIQKAIES